MNRALISLIVLSGCASDITGITAFSPYVTQDGKQAFRFVASNTLPYGDADLKQVHKTLIANELGRRQYCMAGWEIASTTPVDDRLIYEGVCK